MLRKISPAAKAVRLSAAVRAAAKKIFAEVAAEEFAPAAALTEGLAAARRARAGCQKSLDKLAASAIIGGSGDVAERSKAADSKSAERVSRS